MKAGIAEIPDIAIVTKADLGQIAIQTKRDLRSALTTTGSATGRPVDGAWQVPVLSIAAGEQDGTATLIETLDRHRQYLEAGPLIDRRLTDRLRPGWTGSLKEAYGREGLKLIETMPEGKPLGSDQSPFRRLQVLHRALSSAFFRPIRLVVRPILIIRRAYDQTRARNRVPPHRKAFKPVGKCVNLDRFSH